MPTLEPARQPATTAVHDQLYALLEKLYAPDIANAVAERLLARPAIPPPPPARSNPSLLITYADTVHATEGTPLQALKAFLLKHVGDTFGSVHLLPFFPSSSDDGFAVIDYRLIDHHVGSWEDVAALAEDYDLMFDLVINHCSRENLWFADFINGRAPGKDFFITLPEEVDTSAVTRPRSSPLISAVHTYGGIRHVWNTFSADQIDLDFSNPAVLEEFVDILFFYVQRGARLIRLDAVAFLWKRLGTTCMNLPETHAVVQILRLLLDFAEADVQLITETNVPHEENVSYFGDGNETHRVYQFSLAPLLLYTYVFGDSSYLTNWAADLEPPPAGGSCLNFIASHDGVGLRPVEGIVPDAAVEQLVQRMHERGGFVSMRDAGDGDERPYEINISLFSAFGGREEDLPAYLGAHTLLMSFQGVPTFYIHSLVASTNDLANVESTGRTRSINRGHLQTDAMDALLADPASIPAQSLSYLTRALKRRNEQPAFALDASQRVLNVGKHLVVFERHSQTQTLLVVASVVAYPQEIDVASLGLEPAVYIDQLSGRPMPVPEFFTLPPHRVLWLDVSAQRGRAAMPADG